MAKHLNIKIVGMVQGVSFRYAAKEKAEELGIKGFACNDPDGSVYIEVEGEEDMLKQFIAWCHQGPSLAKVEKVEIHESQLRDFKEFLVI